MFNCRGLYADEKDEHESRRLLAAINLYEKEVGISAEGFFMIEKSTLVAMLSTILTYLIILIQFVM